MKKNEDLSGFIRGVQGYRTIKQDGYREQVLMTMPLSSGTSRGTLRDEVY